MDNTSLICNFYMVTLKEGNRGEAGGGKEASYTKIASFCPQPSFPSLVCFGASRALNRKKAVTRSLNMTGYRHLPSMHTVIVN